MADYVRVGSLEVKHKWEFELSAAAPSLLQSLVALTWYRGATYAPQISGPHQRLNLDITVKK